MATTFDGYPLAQQGKPLKALKMSLYASVFGDTFSDLILILVAAPFAVIALKMGPAEITALLLFALTFIAAVVGRSMLRGLVAAAFGMLLATVGLDTEASTPRMTFGLNELEDGIPLLALVIGALALSEVLIQVETYARTGRSEAASVNPFARDVPRENRVVTRAEFTGCMRTLVRSALIGTAIGAIPGLGSTLAGFLGYAMAKRASKNPETFGTGNPEGIAAAEAANSATVGANLIPTLSLAIPGNLSAAVLMSALIVHGLTPGPLIFEQHGKVLYGLFAAMLVANAITLAVGAVGLRFFAFVVSLPARYIHPALVLLCICGAFLLEQSLFAVGLMLGFALLGYVMRKLDFSVVAFLIAFILGPLFEDALRQTMVLFRDNPQGLLQRPIAMVFVALTAWSVWRLGFRARPEILREK
jgi:putative tricarboxylic transport membrane protein